MCLWKMSDAEYRFAEVVRRALAEEPQRVWGHNGDAVVVMSAEEYSHLVAQWDETGLRRKTFAELLRDSPLAELEEGEFQVERSKEPGREITF
jgi:prevent-host-death family protein